MLLQLLRRHRVWLTAAVLILFVIWAVFWNERPTYSKVSEKKYPVVRLGPEVHILNTTRLPFSENQTQAQLEQALISYIETKQVKCTQSIRLGNSDEGGWNVCTSTPYTLQSPCTVYSFGVEPDWKFEDAVSLMYKCHVHAYDKRMDVPDHDRGPMIRFRRISLSDTDSVDGGVLTKSFHTLLLDTPISMLPLHYVKISADVFSLSTLSSMINDGSLSNVKQLAFVINLSDLIHPPSNQPRETKDFVATYNILRGLELAGFMKFDYRSRASGMMVSTVSGKHRNCCYELYYVNMKFFRKNDVN